MDVYKIQIVLLVMQVLIIGLGVYGFKKLKTIMDAHHKNLINSHGYEMKMMKIIEKQIGDGTKTSDEKLRNIQTTLDDLNKVEEIK